MTRQPVIRYVVEGDGPPVLLLHGPAGDHHESLGVSMGAGVAVALAAARPDLDSAPHQRALQHVVAAGLQRLRSQPVRSVE